MSLRAVTAAAVFFLLSGAAGASPVMEYQGSGKDLRPVALLGLDAPLGAFRETGCSNHFDIVKIYDVTKDGSAVVIVEDIRHRKHSL